MMTPFAKVRLVLIITLFTVWIADLTWSLNWLFYLVPIMAFIVYTIVVTSVLSLNAFTYSYTNPVTDRRQLALTFDDGPAPSTLKVLDVLKAHQVKATFFCIGERIGKYPEIMRRIVAEGHNVGNHSYSHHAFFPFFTRSKLNEELDRTNTLLAGYTDRPNDLFRPPFGVMNPTLARVVETSGMKIIGWNLRSFDTMRLDKRYVINKIRRKLKPGTVVLLHDDRPGTSEILESILHYIREKEYEVTDIRTIFDLKKT